MAPGNIVLLDFVRHLQVGNGPLHGVEGARKIVISHAHKKVHVRVLGETVFQVDHGVLFARPGWSVAGNVVESVIFVVQVITDVRLEGGEETILDVGIAEIKAGVGGAGVQLIAGKARVQPRRHQVLIAQQLGAERPQRDAQVEGIEKGLREARVAHHVVQHFFALSLRRTRAVK